MKKLTLSTAFFFIILGAIAQKNQAKDIPQDVRGNFQKQYPAIEEAKWEKEGDKYEVEFKLNGKETSLLYDSKGLLIETEVEIKTEDLPKAVTEYIATNYKGQKIKEASEITAANGIVTYEAEIKNGDLIFDSNGVFLKLVSDDHAKKH